MTISYRLSDIYNLQMGKTPSRDNDTYWKDGEYEWISIADLSKCDKYISQTKEKITKKAVEESGIHIIPADTVIMSFKLSIGKVAITQKALFSNEAIMAFIDKKVVSISPQYAFYLFSAQNWDAGTNRAVMGSTLNKATLSQYRVLIHDVQTQAEIVERLDKLSDLIRHRRQELQKLDDLVKSQFIEMFGDPVLNPYNWPIVNIGEIAIDVRYGTSKPAVEGGQYPYLRMNNLTYEGFLDLSNMKYIDIPDDEIEKYIVRKGDILFNRTNSIDLVGKTCVFDLDEAMIIAGYIIRIRLNDKLLPVVFSNYMNLPVLKKRLRNMAKGAVNQANINAQELKSVRIYLPPIKLQNQFAAFVEQTDKSKFRIKQNLEKLEILYKSLLQEYFG